MPKYTVYMLTPYIVWEDIEADSEEQATAQCEPEVWPDPVDGPICFIAEEEEEK